MRVLFVKSPIRWKSICPDSTKGGARKDNFAAVSGTEPKNIAFLTYARLMTLTADEIAVIQPDFIILDEFHRCGAEQWGKGIQSLLSAYPSAPLLGLSATNIRFLDNQRDMAAELFDGHIASEITLGEAIARGILKPPKYVLSVYSFQKDLEKYESRAAKLRDPTRRNRAMELLKTLRRNLENADGLDVIFARHMPNRHGRYIVFCSNAAHMNRMISRVPEWFSQLDADPHIYRAYSPDPVTREAFDAFRNDDTVPLVTDLAVYRMPEVYQRSRVFLWRLQYRYVRRRANFFLAISEFTKKEMTELWNLPPEKIYVVPCACSSALTPVSSPERIKLLRQKYSLPERFVLFVGNSNPRKNLKRLIQAFDRAKTEENLPHQLVIAGEQGWKFDRNQAVEGIRNRENVRFIGFVPDEDMPALYSAASLFMFPTLYEGFGIPVLEAQACGVPVLASRCSALPEVGGDGVLYVDPYDVESISRGIRTVLTDPALAGELARKGLENVGRFSWERSARRLHEIIEKEVSL